MEDRLLTAHALQSRVVFTAGEVLRVCAARADEAIIVLVDEATAPLLKDAFTSAIFALGQGQTP